MDLIGFHFNISLSLKKRLKNYCNANGLVMSRFVSKTLEDKLDELQKKEAKNANRQ